MSLKLTGLATKEQEKFNGLSRNDVVPGMRIPGEIEEMRYNALAKMASEEMTK